MVNANSIFGVFAGNVQVNGKKSKMIMELGNNNDIKILLSEYGNSTFKGSYYYNTETKNLNIDINKKGDTSININDINFRVTKWSREEINVISSRGNPIKFNAVSDFNLNSIGTSTISEVTIELPTIESNGNIAIGRLTPISGTVSGKEIITDSIVHGNNLNLRFFIDNVEFGTNTTSEYALVVFLFKRGEDIDLYFLEDETISISGATGGIIPWHPSVSYYLVTIVKDNQNHVTIKDISL